MFILNPEDVQLSTIQHPKRNQPVSILKYQGQSFRLISIFSAQQEAEAKAFWRELTDNRGKTCILLAEAARYSVWGKVRLNALPTDNSETSQN